MTVPEPTPDRASRWSLVRRGGFFVSAAGLVVAFALSLSGIASTRGAVRPETQAAVVAAAQRHSGATDADTATGPRRGHCRHGDRQRGGTAGVGRV